MIESSETKFAIVNEGDNVIQCVGVYPYHEAIGHLICLMTEYEGYMKDDEYEIIKRDDFCELEGQTGYGWFRTYYHKGSDITIKDRWYLLAIEE